MNKNLNGNVLTSQKACISTVWTTSSSRRISMLLAFDVCMFSTPVMVDFAMSPVRPGCYRHCPVENWMDNPAARQIGFLQPAAWAHLLFGWVDNWSLCCVSWRSLSMLLMSASHDCSCCSSSFVLNFWAAAAQEGNFLRDICRAALYQAFVAWCVGCIQQLYRHWPMYDISVYTVIVLQARQTTVSK